MLRKKSKSQIARENGAKSRGPKTPQGKAASKFNALKHGFTAQQSILLAEESEPEFQAFSEAHFQHYRPATDMEAIALHDIISAAWRLRRLALSEVTLMDMETARLRAFPSPIEPVDGPLRITLALTSLTLSPRTSVAAHAALLPQELEEQQEQKPDFDLQEQDHDQQQRQSTYTPSQLTLIYRYTRTLSFLHAKAVRYLEQLQANRPSPLPDTDEDTTAEKPTNPTEPNEPTNPQPTPIHSLTDPPAPRGRIFLRKPDLVKCQAM